MVNEREDRIAKLELLKQHKINPYPISSNKQYSIKQVLDTFNELTESKKEITICGRIRSLRHHGKSFFLDLEDSGDKIQGYIQPQNLGEEIFNIIKKTIDEGDIIQITGNVMTTKRGEKTIVVIGIKFLTKTLRPLPEKWHGLIDTETRLRQRYLDFLANPHSRFIIEIRSRVINSIRQFYNQDGFIEVETPILQPLPGGANARPFITHHNSLDQDFYLRIAPELYLKRLLVGGFERVFEIGKNFRNEGIDAQHNPEFTSLEAYAAFWDATKMRRHVEELFLTIAKALPDNYGKKITPPFLVETFNNLILKYTSLNLTNIYNLAELIEQVQCKTKLHIEKHWSRANILDELFKECVRPYLTEPIFVIDYFYEAAPLAKRKEENPLLIDRFQLIINGFEIVNAFSEANDPLDQRLRFIEQEQMRNKGDDEAQRIDEDFLTALEHGMPPAAGMGMGIDRLISILTETHNIKETMCFPTLKVKK